MRDFGLIHQRLHAVHVGLSTIVAGLFGPDIGLGHGDVRRGCLLVGRTGALLFGLGIGQSGAGGGGCGLRGIGSERHHLPGGMSLAFGLQYGGLGHIDSGLIIARIDAHQHLPGLDRLVIQHRHFNDIAVDLGRYGGDVPVDIGVVGGDAVAIVQPGGRGAPRKHQQDHQEHEDPLAGAASGRRLRLVPGILRGNGFR